MEELNLRNYAYLGDAVWELHIRTKTIRQANNAKILHKITTDKVKTGFQCELLHKISEKLGEEELELARRARNLPIPVGRKNIQNEYRQATAFEALIGWWYEHDKQRLEEILNFIDSNYITFS